MQGDTQYRYIWQTGEIVPFRKPSYNSNGNCFDFQGRQLSCQHYFRRVVRWELDGSMTVIADQFEGKSLNAPNDIAAHPDGSIWFTDPGAGASLSEGHPDVAGGPQNPNGLYDPRLGDAGTGLGTAVRRELPANVYRWDPSGKLEIAVPADKIKGCNGICFSPDYKRVYIIGGGIHVGDVVDGKVMNFRDFTDCMVDGIYCHPDGMRADRAGNIWSQLQHGSGLFRRHGVESEPASASAASACRKAAPMSASAGPSATICSCARPSRCSCSRSISRARRRAERNGGSAIYIKWGSRS